QLLVSGDLVANGAQTLDDVGMIDFEAAAGVGIGRVESTAIPKNQPHAVDGLVAVFSGATTHAARVVCGAAADHKGTHRGWIRSNLSSMGGEHRVGLCSNDAGLQSDPRAAVINPVVAPTPGEDQ